MVGIITFQFISNLENNGGIIGHVIDQKRITTSEESKAIVAIHAVPALAAGATPLLTVSTVPPGRAASIRVSTRLMCSTVACVCKTLLLFRWVRSWKWGRNQRWSRRWWTTDISRVRVTGIKTGLLAELFLDPELVNRALFGAAVWNETPAIAIFVVCNHIWRPLVMTFNAAPIIGLNFS